jgi:single-strand DNA-binding protein
MGKDPETKHTTSGATVTRFSLATEERWKDKSGEKRAETEWHTIVAWRKLAEVCGQYLAKGKQVYVEGKLQSRSWENNGTKHTITEIVADQIVMLGTKNGDAPTSSASRKHSDELGITDEDIPF